MPLFPEQERETAAAIGSLVCENPFLPGRIAAEQKVLGDAFVPEKRVWSLELHGESNPNLAAIARRAEELAAQARERIGKATKSELELYDDLVTYVLQRVVQYGTGTAAALANRPVAGKTGTAENYVDAWFCGYVPQLATCVWVGYPGREIAVYDGSEGRRHDGLLADV